MKPWVVGHRRRTGLALCVGCALGVAACRPDPAPHPSTHPASAPRSPAETVRHMHACRVSGLYAELADLLAPDQQQPVLELVRAVDELIAAERYLQETIRTRVGEGSAAAFAARAQVANILGPLSQVVRIVGETIDGETAKVTIQVADRVPLETVNLARLAGTWRVVTDKPIAGLPDELRKLAEADRRVARELLRRPLTGEEVERELAFRQEVILRRIAHLTEQAK